MDTDCHRGTQRNGCAETGVGRWVTGEFTTTTRRILTTNPQMTQIFNPELKRS